jgi:hypothetical protein
MIFNNNILTIYAIANIFLSIYNMRNRYISNNFLSAVNGMHLTFSIFFGVGFLAYINYDIQKDAIRKEDILRELESLLPYLTLGYLFVTIMEYFRFVRQEISIKKFNFSGFNSNLFCTGFLSLAYLGLVFKQLSFSTTSIGTFFPVFNNFVYPITILIIVNVKKKNSYSIILLLALFFFIGIEAVFSAWRSQLILFAISILIGLNIRGKINYYLLIIIGITYFFFILPFQQIKKINFIDFNNNPVEAFKSTLEYSFNERSDILLEFLAERINYTREIAYVQIAINNSNLEYRNGDTYIELIYQIIPRIFWHDKPSYNNFTNYLLPRKVQLLQWEDPYTSWAVNSYAEFIYNFPYQFLPFFIIIIYTLLSYLDRLCINLNLLPEFSWFLQTTLFFLSINLVSVIYSSTYFLWAFIVIIISSKIFNKKNENSYLRRN